MNDVLREEDPWRDSPRDPSTMSIPEIRDEWLRADEVNRRTGSIPRATSAMTRMHALTRELLTRIDDQG